LVLDVFGGGLLGKRLSASNIWGELEINLCTCFQKVSSYSSYCDEWKRIAYI